MTVIRKLVLFALLMLPINVALAGAQNYCSQGEGRAVLFLIDRTSVFDQQDKKSFADGVDVLFNHLQTGERLVIHTLTEDFSSSKKFFDACRPGCLEQGLTAGLFSQCRASRAKMDERKYLRSVLTSVKPLILNQEKYPNSEIIETIAFMMQEYEQKKPDRLIIFSDLIEHSRLAKFGYLEEEDIEPLLDKLDKLGLIRPMEGVDVEVFGFGRDHSVQRKGLRAGLKRNIELFWQAYFKRAKASKFHLGRDLNL